MDKPTALWRCAVVGLLLTTLLISWSTHMTVVDAKAPLPGAAIVRDLTGGPFNVIIDGVEIPVTVKITATTGSDGAELGKLLRSAIAGVRAGVGP